MTIPKILAMYLPQFHRVKENDEWWGEDFTEWTTVKAAKPLYPEHEQPVEPMDYYDLMNKEVMRKQATYMHQYGIDGMCFYHYYFEKGRMILEKPVENLLQWKDIEMPFCFCWANDSWIRSWSNVSGNTWSELFENKGVKKGNGVLLQQGYGDKSDWEAHFNYLLPFFKDTRYLKVNECPIFLIYNPMEMDELAEMRDCWNNLIKKEGMPAVFFIGKGTDRSILDGAMYHEPVNTWNDLWGKRFQNQYNIQFILSYDEVWEKILQRPHASKNMYLGGFVGFDDTPRHGYMGKIIYGRTPEKFEKYLIRLLLKAGKNKNEMIFINAWNEWGEGMYLEPDKKWGTRYLEAVKNAKDFVENYGDIVEESWSDNLQGKIDRGDSENNEIVLSRVERYRHQCNILRRWLSLHLQNRSICSYIDENLYKKVAIYGLGILGSLLADEMSNHNLQITYGIDQDIHKGRKFDFPVYRLQDSLPEADLVVVTVDYAYDVIRKQLEEKGDFRVISLEKLLDFTEEKHSRKDKSVF